MQALIQFLLLVLRLVGHACFVLVNLVGVLVAGISLPGSVLVFLAALVFSAVHGWQRPSPAALAVLFVLMLVAETADNILSWLGVRRGGGTPLTGLVAVVAALLGSLMAAQFAPLLGLVGLVGGFFGWLLATVLVPLLAALVCGFLAAYAYELRQVRRTSDAQRAAAGALAGRLMGMLAKFVITGAMAAICIATAYFPAG